MIIEAFSEPGGKIANEDFVIARRHPGPGNGCLCILADGQGGRAHGALAARTACEAAWRLASKTTLESLLRGGAWEGILQQIDAEVSATGGFTTLVALAVDSHFASGASCGDSKAYYSGGEGAELVEWTQGQRKNPPVGSGEAVFMAFRARVTAGGRLLLLSDGGWKYCGYEALRASFGVAVPGLREHFYRAILGRAGSMLPDDLSIIAVDVG